MIEVKRATEEDLEFVAGCGHSMNNEVAESVRRRTQWFLEKWQNGLVSLIGLLKGKHVGFLNMFPIEISPWGPIGKELYVINCLFVTWDYQKNGVGKRMMSSAIDISRSTSRKGIISFGYTDPKWYLPVSFFEKSGFREISRNGDERLMMLALSGKAEIPKQMVSKYTYEPVEGKIVVDLFFNRFCSTSDIEAYRVMRVLKEFKDNVVFNLHEIEEPGVKEEFGLPRAIFVNGKEIFWGYEAPESGIRQAIVNAINCS